MTAPHPGRAHRDWRNRWNSLCNRCCGRGLAGTPSDGSPSKFLRHLAYARNARINRRNAAFASSQKLSRPLYSRPPRRHSVLLLVLTRARAILDGRHPLDRAGSGRFWLKNPASRATGILARASATLLASRSAGRRFVTATQRNRYTPLPQAYRAAGFVSVRRLPTISRFAGMISARS